MWQPKSVGVLVILVMVLGALAAGILSPPSVGSLTAGTASADPAVPNPGHHYSEIELPPGTWSGLDADKVDGLDASQIAAGRAGFSVTSLDTAGTVGQYTSATVGVDGLGLISYYDATNGNLKVTHCSNRFCVPYHRPR